MEKQNRFKSKAAWAAVATLLFFILKTYGLLASMGLTEYSFKEVTTLIFAVLIAARDLNDQVIRTRQGKLWGSVAIYRVLQNETYLGKIISNKQKGDSHKIRKPSSEAYRKLPKEEWIIVENCHEAIITQDEFDKTQVLNKKRTLIPPAARASRGEFTGVLRCKCCGHTMRVQRKKEGYKLFSRKH